VSAIIDSALFKVFDGLTKRVEGAAGLVPSSVPLLAWETGTGTVAGFRFSRFAVRTTRRNRFAYAQSNLSHTNPVAPQPHAGS